MTGVPHRVLLVLADEEPRFWVERELEQMKAEFDRVEVKAVAPVRPDSSLALLTGEVDDSIAAAEERAQAAAERSRDSSADSVEAEAGEADPLLAIEDALASFEADQIVLAIPDEELPAKARERFGLPVRTIEPPR